jgi:hypothetical protein
VLLRIVFGVFLIAHGLIHVLWFVPTPDDPKWPFTIARSPLLPWLSAKWLRVKAIALVALIIGGYMLAALGVFGVPGLSQIWGTAAIVASALSIVATAIFWNRQLIWGPLIDIAIIAAVVVGWPIAS